MRLKAKFQHSTLSGVKIGFKLPNGTQTHTVFLTAPLVTVSTLLAGVLIVL